MTPTTTDPIPPQQTSLSPPLRKTPPLRRREASEQLIFSPLAWLKLQFFLHAGDTEVGGFGVCSKNDPLYVDDFATVRQRVTPVSVEFADDAVADHFDRCVDAGLSPSRFARVWLHTHPGDSPRPSSTDEETFARVFGACDWSVMFIISRTGQTYARLAFSAGPGGAVLLRTAVDWTAWPQVLLERSDELGELFERWGAEFEQNVHSDIATYPRPAADDGGWDLEELHQDRFHDERFTRLFEGWGQGVYP